MGQKLSAMHKRTTLVIMGLLTLSAVAATQFATVSLDYSFTITGADSGIRFIGHDVAKDAVTLLRADNDQGQNLRLELGDWARGQSVTYTAAFGIVNENLQGINITTVSVTGTGTSNLYLWLHNNADTKATLDSGTLIYDGVNGAQTFAWALTAGNGNSGDANSILTPLNPESHTRTLNATDNATDTDHAWLQIKLIIPETQATGTFSGTISFTFEESEAPLTLTSPNGGESWEASTSQNIQWSGADTSVSDVKLEYSKDNFTSDVNTIVASTPNDGSYAWTVANDADSSVWVRVSDVNSSSTNDKSDSSFEITAADTNLMAHLKFDEGTGNTANDETTHNNDGSLTNGAAWATVAVDGGGVNLDGTNDYVSLTDDTTLDVGSSDSYTFQLWFNSESNAKQTLFKKKVVSGDSEYVAKLKQDGRVEIQIKDASNNKVKMDSGASTDYTDSQWHLLTMVIDRSNNKLYLYMDGSNTVTPPSISSVGDLSNSAALLLGSKEGGGEYFDGRMDDFKVWNRALSSSEISANYNSYTKSLTLAAPNGGESWQQGTNQAVTWTASGPINNVKLEYSKDNFVSDINTIVSSTASDGSYTWTVPNDPSSTVRVRVSDASDSSVKDTSDADFTITS